MIAPSIPILMIGIVPVRMALIPTQRAPVTPVVLGIGIGHAAMAVVRVVARRIRDAATAGTRIIARRWALLSLPVVTVSIVARIRQNRASERRGAQTDYEHTNCCVPRVHFPISANGYHAVIA